MASLELSLCMSYTCFAAAPLLMVLKPCHRSLEGWSFEFIVLLFGILPNPELETSVLSVCLNTIATLYSIPYGLSGAVSTRDSNDLGAGNPQGARICVFTMMLVTVMEAILVIMSSILDDHIGQLIWVLCCLLFMLKFVILVARLSSKSELPSIKILSNEFLFEVFKRAQGSHTKCVAACVSKRWHMLLSNVRSSEILPEQEPYQSIRLLAELSSNIQK